MLNCWEWSYARVLENGGKGMHLRDDFGRKSVPNAQISTHMPIRGPNMRSDIRVSLLAWRVCAGVSRKGDRLVTCDD